MEHLAILTRWHGSSWRDGEWLGFESVEKIPYRKLVNAMGRVHGLKDMIKSLHDSWLPRAWRKFRAVWTQGLRQQVTGTGVAYTAAMGVVGAGAFISANNLLFLIFAAMLSTLLVSGFISRLGIAGLEINLMVPEHISARRKVRAGIRIRNLKRVIPSFSIHLAGSKESGFDAILYFPVIPGGAVLEEPVELYFPKRGAQRERTFQFSTRFPFGFSERREMVTAQHDILVYPCVDAQPGFEALLQGVRGEMEAQQRGRGHDFYRIRPYEALESARHVDWKATAHTGDLQVREFAREQDNRVVIYFDLDTECRGMVRIGGGLRGVPGVPTGGARRAGAVLHAGVRRELSG